MQRRRHGKSHGGSHGARPQGPRPGPGHPTHSGHSSRPKFYKINCSGCGKEVIVQVPPPEDKKLLCMDCFRK